MKAFPQILPRSFIVAVIVASLSVVTAAHARQGATDPIPGTSKGATNSGGGGGGGKSSTVVVAPTPAPAPAPAPIVTKTLAFTSVSQINGVDPVCTGSYHIDPYYPTLSLMTVNVETSSVNAPDGSVLHVSVTGTGGTLYPFTSDIIYVLGGNGLSTYCVYVTPGTVITGVVVSDDFGHVVSTGL
jgi:hypothetical protein